MRIIIAGGGLGGLTLALMLHQQGIGCQVYEAAAEVKPLGVGINALPHSIRELAALGLLPRLDEIAIRTRQLTYANHLGQPIWSEPRGLFAGHDVPQFSVHRGRLHAMLWQAATERLGPVAPRSGCRLLGYRQDNIGVTAILQHPDGSLEEATGDALIGADGIHSTLRTGLHPDDAGIRWNGIQMWRGAVDWPAFDGGDSMVIAGDAVAKLVLYPIGLGETSELAADQLGDLCPGRAGRRTAATAGKLVAPWRLRSVPAFGRTAAPAVHRCGGTDPEDRGDF